MLPSPPDDPQGVQSTLPVLRPLDAFEGTLAQRTYQSLREAILSLALRPGAALKKPEICDALGVSRSPVSEAMARLSGEGLVDIAPQAGTFVARLSMAEIREGAFLREAIELAAIERVAGTITEDQLVLLRRGLRIQQAHFEDGDFAGFYAQDAEMHHQLLSFTEFRNLATVADTAWVHVNRARRLILPLPGRVAETLEEHRAIVASLEARDPVAARDAMRHHLRQLMTFLAPLEREHPDLFQPAPRPR